MKAKVFVCEDEKIERDKLVKLISEASPGAEISAFETAEKLLQTVALGDADIIFLDIELPGMNGVEAAKLIRKNGKRNGSAQSELPVIIFVTGLKDYVFDAFDVGALNYLIKPVNKAKFREVYEKALSILKNKNAEGEKIITLHDGAATKPVRLSDILYVESSGRKVLVHTVREKLLAAMTMSGIEDRLDERFFRCHRSFIVNMDYISRYTSSDISLSDGTTVMLSRYQYKAFVDAFCSHILPEAGNAGN